VKGVFPPNAVEVFDTRTRAVVAYEAAVAKAMKEANS
jgi:hypothetical protein